MTSLLLVVPSKRKKKLTGDVVHFVSFDPRGQKTHKGKAL